MATSGKKEQVGFRQKKLPSECQVPVHLIYFTLKIKSIDFIALNMLKNYLIKAFTNPSVRPSFFLMEDKK